MSNTWERTKRKQQGRNEDKKTSLTWRGCAFAKSRIGWSTITHRRKLPNRFELKCGKKWGNKKVGVQQLFVCVNAVKGFYIIR